MATGGCYDILLVGSIGMGKSTAGNKLLKISLPENQSIPFTPEEDAAIPFFVSKGSLTSTTQYCKLLSKESSKVRVLDTPGFSNSHGRELSNYDGNLYTFRKILLSQRENGIAFSRVLYFLPQRGPLHRADGKLQEEIKVMYDFFDKAIFNVMIIIATNPQDSRRQIKFSEEDMKFTERAFVTAFESITGDNLPKCPPILYLPVDEIDLLSRVKDAPVLHDTALHLDTKDEKCTKCSLMLTYTCVRNEKVLIGADDKIAQRLVPVDESKCHTYSVPKYSRAAKIIGGIAHILTLCIPLFIFMFVEKRGFPGFIRRGLEKLCCPPCELLVILCLPVWIVWMLLETLCCEICKLQNLQKYACYGLICILWNWPGFTNSEEVCENCRQDPSAKGCCTYNESQTTETCHLIPDLMQDKF